MIIANQRERLFMLGNAKADLDRLTEDAHRRHDEMKSWNIDDTFKTPITLDYNEEYKALSFKFAHRAQYSQPKGYTVSDGTAYAFGQACNTWGIPVKYAETLFADGMQDLAYENIRRRAAFAAEKGRYDGMKALVSNNCVEAFVSDRYDDNFPTCDILEVVQNAVDTSRYTANQAYLSNSKMHLRMIDFDNPLDIGGEKMTFGFTVDSSDVGKSALRVTFFIYKFSCKNGIVHISHGGKIYSQKHLGAAFTQDSIDEFKASFKTLEDIRENCIGLITTSQNRMMSQREMYQILDACKNYNVNMGEKEKEKIINLAEVRYGRTKWGLINGITEVAQDHTLDNRIAYETWADRILSSKSA